MYDVIISGGGPAGSYAAYRCAAAGLRTILFEKESESKNKCCAGGLLNRARKKLEFDVPESLLEREITGFDIYGKDFQESFRFPRPLCHTVDRQRFDRWLLNKAENVGVEIFFEKKVSSITQNDGAAVCTVGEEKMEAKVVIIAEGANSLNASRVLGQYPGRNRALGMRVVEPATVDPGGTIEVFMLDTPTPRIERGPFFPLMGWMFPYSRAVNLGVGGLGYGRSALENGLRATIKASKTGVDEKVVENACAHPIPIVARPRLVQGRIMAIGDAAGMVSPLSGEGMSHGFDSAIMASNVAIEEIRSGRAVLSLMGYQRAVRDTVAKDIKAAALISPNLHWLIGVVDASKFLQVLQRDQSYLDSWARLANGEEGWRSLLLKTIPRFPRFFFSSL